MRIDPERVAGGPVRADFEDRSGQACSIQSSSLADEPCVWLGVDLDVDGNPSTRMHLTRGMAAELARLLERFAATGRLDGPREAVN